MASLTQWTGIWANSGRQGRTEEPGKLQSLGSQRVRHALAAEQQQPHSLEHLSQTEHQTNRPERRVQKMDWAPYICDWIQCKISDPAQNYSLPGFSRIKWCLLGGSWHIPHRGIKGLSLSNQQEKCHSSRRFFAQLLLTSKSCSWNPVLECNASSIHKWENWHWLGYLAILIPCSQ